MAGPSARAGRIGIACRSVIAAAVAALVLAPSSNAGTEDVRPAKTVADYGDAPDGKAAGYGPGVVGRFPSRERSNGARHTNSGPLRLGQDVNRERNSRQVDADRFDDGFSAQLERCKTGKAYFVVDATGVPAALRAAGHSVYLNAWFDWNRNGRWGGASGCNGGAAQEWAVQNVAVDLALFAEQPIRVIEVQVPAGRRVRSIWQRATVTLDETAATPDGRGRYVNGETEDYGPGVVPARPRDGNGRTRAPVDEPVNPLGSCTPSRLANFAVSGIPGFMPHGAWLFDAEIFDVKLVRGKGKVKVKVGKPTVVGEAPEGILAGIRPEGELRWDAKRELTVWSLAEDFRENPVQIAIIPVTIRGPDLTKPLKLKCVVIVAHEVLTPAGAGKDPAADPPGDGSRDGRIGGDGSGEGKPAGLPKCRGGGSWQGELVPITSPPAQTNYYYSFGTTPISYWSYYFSRFGGATAGCNHDVEGRKNVEANVDIRDPSGKLIAWNYDYPPFPSTEDGPDDANGDDYCPEQETLPDGRVITRMRCTLGIPNVSGVPPPEQGFPTNSWPQNHGRYPYYSVVLGVGHHFKEGISAGAYATVVWRRK